MIKIKPVKWFRPVEIVLFAYILVVSFLMLCFHASFPGFYYHLILTWFPTAILVIIILLQEKYQKNTLLKVFRLFGPLLLLPILYHETDYLNNFFFKENLDPIFAEIEFLFFNSQPSILFAESFSANWLAELMYFSYFSYYLLILFIPLYAYIKTGAIQAEKIIFIIINSFLIYYAVFIIFPVAGPQFYFFNELPSLPDGFLFGSLIKTIQLHGEGETGAFPSSHVSICMMILYICFTKFKNLFPLVLIISVLLIFSTVYIRAHYVIDVVGAIIITPLFYSLSIWTFKQLNPRIQ